MWDGRKDDQADLINEIAAAYNDRLRPQRLTTDKQECDQFRKKFANVLSHVSTSLTEMNRNIQALTDPYQLIETVKQGYLNAIENMCSTLDYGNNIQLLSRMTKKLRMDRQQP